MKTQLLLTALLAVGLAGCQTNPVSGRTQLVLVSEEQAQASSAQAYAQTVNAAQQKGKLSTDAVLNARVKRITDRLIVQAGNHVSAQPQLEVVGRGDRRAHAQCLVHAGRQDGDLHRHHPQAKSLRR